VGLTRPQCLSSKLDSPHAPHSTSAGSTTRQLQKSLRDLTSVCGLGAARSLLFRGPPLVDQSLHVACAQAQGWVPGTFLANELANPPPPLQRIVQKGPGRQAPKRQSSPPRTVAPTRAQQSSKMGPGPPPSPSRIVALFQNIGQVSRTDDSRAELGGGGKNPL